MKKQLPTAVIRSELAHSSVFFQKPVVSQPNDPMVKPAQGKPLQPHSLPPAKPPHSSTAPADEELPSKANQQPPSEVLKQDIKTDVVIDVVTSLSQDVILKQWQEIIENTETQNSALRLTSEERYAIEDVVNELRRKYGVKTSMNEIARLGLMLLTHDFKKNKKESMIHKVKKA